MKKFETEVLQYTGHELSELRHMPEPAEGGLPHILLSVGEFYLCLSDEWAGWGEADPWDTDLPVNLGDYEWYRLG